MSDTFKIAHIADTHLRARQYGNTERGTDFLKGFRSAIEAAADSGIHYMIVAGDILDTRNPGATVCIEDLSDIQALAVRKGVQLLWIQGNHDKVSSGDPHWIDWYNEQDDDGYGFRYIGGDKVIIGNDNVTITVAGLDYCHDQEFRELLPELPDADIFVWHAAIKDFCGFPVETAVTVRELADAGKWKVVAMGDIHEHKKIECDGMVVAYPGSTEMCSSAEEFEKCMWVYEFDKGRNLVGVSTLPFNTREKQAIRIDTAADMDSFAEKVHAGAVVYVKYNDSIENALYRINNHGKEGVLIVASSYSVDTRGNVTEVARDLDVNDPVKYLREVLPSLAKDEEQAERIGNLCAALFDQGIDPVSEIEAFVSNRMA